MAAEMELSEPARLLLLASLLAKDGLISHNGKGFLKDLILRRDEELLKTFAGFGSNTSFLQDLHGLIDRESRRLFDSLFAGLSLSEGKSLSKAERRRKGLMNDRALIYGEVDFSSFATILREVAAVRGSKAGEVFYDLGSGTGKAVYVARLTQDFTHCVGIEILRPLHSAAQLVTNRYNAQVKSLLDRGRPQNAAVFVGSFLEYDWSDGDCVFANSTCFPEELMDALARQAEELKPGAILVTFTKGLDSTAFEVLSKRRFDMSWGPATVFIHRRCNGSGRPLASRAPVSTSEPARLTAEGGPSGSDGDGDSTIGSDSSIDSDSSSGGSSSSSEPTPNPNGSVGSSGVVEGGKSGGGGGGGGGSGSGFGGLGGDAAQGIEGRGGTKTPNGVGRAGGAGEEQGKAGKGSDGGDDVNDEYESSDGSNEEKEREREREGGGDGDSDGERGYMFDTEQRQNGDNNPASGANPNPDRFMGFGELLRQAEQAQAQTLEQLNVSRKELLAMPDELAHTIDDGDSRDSGDGDEEEEEEELDELHDLSDEGTADGALDAPPQGDQDHTVGGDGQAEPVMGEDPALPTDLGEGAPRSGGEEGAGKTQGMGGVRQGLAVAVADGDAAAVGASGGDETEVEPELGSPKDPHGMESCTAVTPGEAGKVEGEQQQQLRDDREQHCTLEIQQVAAVAAAAAVSTGGNDATEPATDDGSNGADASNGTPLDGGSGASAERDWHGEGDVAANGAEDTGDVETVDTTMEVPNGNPDEVEEAGSARSPPPPSPPGRQNDSAEARATSKGAAAAMQCQWLPIKLPPPPPSAKGGGVSREAVEPPSRALPSKGGGLDSPPAVEVEALESPQDAALLKRKADRDPCCRK